MGYAVYDDGHRFAGYGVPAECDYIGCTQQIDRGLSYKCEEYWTYRYYLNGKEIENPIYGFLDDISEVEELEEGCGLFFCGRHEDHEEHAANSTESADIEEWEMHILTDDSWQEWRDENPEQTKQMEQRWLA